MSKNNVVYRHAVQFSLHCTHFYSHIIKPKCFVVFLLHSCESNINCWMNSYFVFTPKLVIQIQTFFTCTSECPSKFRCKNTKHFQHCILKELVNKQKKQMSLETKYEFTNSQYLLIALGPLYLTKIKATVLWQKQSKQQKKVNKIKKL